MFSQYINIDEMDDGVVYIPNDLNDDEKNLPEDLGRIRLSPPLDELELTLERSGSTPPLHMYGDAFVTESTFKDIQKIFGEEYFQAVMIEYIIGIDKPQNVYTVVNALRDLYKDDDEGIFYQAQGLERLIKDSRTTVVIQFILLVVLDVFQVFIQNYLATILTKNIIEDMIVFYLNGMSRKSICIEYNSFIGKRILLSILSGAVISIILGFFASRIAYPLEEFKLTLIIILIILNLTIAFLVIGLLKFFLKQNIYKGTGAGEISKLLRN